MGRVIYTAWVSREAAVGSGSGGESLHPTAMLSRFSRFIAASFRRHGLDEGGLKTRRLTPVGSAGVCGWLADGYHFPKTFGGQPKPISEARPLVASLHGGRAFVIGDRHPPAEGRMVQCRPAFRVANPYVCPGSSLGQPSGGNWMAREISRWLRSRGLSGLGVELRLGLRPCKYPDHPSGGGV